MSKSGAAGHLMFDQKEGLTVIKLQREELCQLSLNLGFKLSLEGYRTLLLYAESSCVSRIMFLMSECVRLSDSSFKSTAGYSMFLMRTASAKTFVLIRNVSQVSLWCYLRTGILLCLSVNGSG